MKILIVLISLISVILYRMGGVGKPFNTKIRDLGIPALMTVSLLALGLKVPWWAILLNFGLLFGALTTYWNIDELKWGFWAHGLGVSLSALPIALATGLWLGFAIRVVIVTAFMAIWSQMIDEVNLEEGGRGAIIMATVPLLL